MSTTSKVNKRLSPLLMDSVELAELLGIDDRTVWRWVSSGKLPKPIRRGRKWTRWRRKDIEAWLEDE